MSSKQERSVEDYRGAVIALKKTYKQLGEKHLALQENFQQLERRRIKATAGKDDMFSKTLKAQIMNKKAMQIQAMIRGGFWRATVKALKEKQRKAKNIQLTQQERYLRYVQESTESYEFKAAAEKLENHLKMHCGLSLKMLFRGIDKNNQCSILTEDLRMLLKKISSKQQDSPDMSPAIIEKVMGGLDRNQCGYISLEKFKEALISAGLEKPDKQISNKSNANSKVFPDEDFCQDEGESFAESTDKTPMQLYLESALQRVAEIIDASGLTTQQVFSKLSVVQGDFMLGDRFFTWLDETSTEGMFRLSKDEKKALTIAFNLDHTQFIKKHEFIVKLLPLQRNIAKAAAQSSRPTSKLTLTEKNALSQNNNLLSPPVPASLNVSSASGNNNNVNSSKLSAGRFSVNSIIKGGNKYEGGSVLDWENVQSIINRLFATQPLHLFLEKILFSYSAEKSSLNIEEVSRLLDSYLSGSASSNNVSLMEKGMLFRAMDADGNGQLEMNELIDFFTTINKNVKLSLQTFLIMQAKYLEIERIPSIQFFKDMGLDLETIHPSEDIGINLKMFHDTFGDALGLDEESINRLFVEIASAKQQMEKNNLNSDKKTTISTLKNQGMSSIPDGTISARELMRIIDGYRSDSLGNVMVRQEDKQVQNKLKRLDEFKLALEVQGRMTIQKLWNKADQENKGYLSLFELKNAIKTALPLLSSLSIIRILSSIDLNENGIIDKEEFRLAFLNSEAELAQTKNAPAAASSSGTTPNPSQRNIREKQSKDPEDLLVISRLKDALIHKGLTPLKFFELADSDKSGSISLVEMRVALADMNIDLGNLIKLMKIFDINKNGFIEFQEFVEILGNDLAPTTATRGTSKITALVTLNQAEKVIDKRGELDINQRLDEYGPEQPNELKEAILSLGRAVKEKQASKGKGKNNDMLVLQDIFKEFDSNSDKELSRAEFLSGIDSLNAQLRLTERQKVRLAITADRNKDDKIDLNEFVQFLEETVEKLEYEERRKREKEQQGYSKPSILKIGGGFELDVAGQKEMLKEKMENCLQYQLQSLMEENQLSGQFGPGAMKRKAQAILELALKDIANTDQKLSISTLKGILVANTFQFKLTTSQIDSLLAAFASEFSEEIEDNRIVSTTQLNQLPIDQSMIIQEDVENENEY